MRPATTMPGSEPRAIERRTLSTRNATWARALARTLGRAGVRPNSISLAGIVFAAGGCAGFVVVPGLSTDDRAVAFVMAALAIQLRLLCNLLDGMLAVEEGFRTSSGAIFNDLPDRIADIVLLLGAGYSMRGLSAGPTLGWAAAVLAVFTAYVRVLGGSLGVRQPFLGPMAKQHRMFTLTLGSLAAAGESALGLPMRSMAIGLGVIIAGSIATIARRTHWIVREVEAR